MLTCNKFGEVVYTSIAILHFTFPLFVNKIAAVLNELSSGGGQSFHQFQGEIYIHFQHYLLEASLEALWSPNLAAHNSDPAFFIVPTLHTNPLNNIHYSTL